MYAIRLMYVDEAKEVGQDHSKLRLIVSANPSKKKMYIIFKIRSVNKPEIVLSKNS